ncbi:gasdermin-D [Orycteropus afer afer]|uniref:Gasdermin-D n=1 Tax=Orycteropus afer afer TaxID=1230840 RepID=A0A8B7B2C0_ORYAF|nr:gasdermin-D [Orycteropus afer afer]
MSAFESVAQAVVQELDRGGSLIPVDSLRSSTSFQPYCLLHRNPSRSRFWKPRYLRVNLSIWDILEPSTPEPAVHCSASVHFHDAVDGQLQGNVELGGPAQGKLAGGATVARSSSASMDVCVLHVDSSTWETLQRERRVRQPEHKILQQLRSRGDDVYVVTEVLQTQKEVEVTRTHKQEGLGQFALPGGLCIQGEGQGHLNRKKTVTIPSGSILAFQVAQLVIGSNWDIFFFPDKKRRTFQRPAALKAPSGEASRSPPPLLASVMKSIRKHCKLQTDGSEEQWALVTEDCAGLRAELEDWARDLGHLSSGLQRELLGALGTVLRDARALQALEEALEEGLRCGLVEPRDGPERAVLECLVLPSRELVKELAVPTLYLLGALAALNEPQHLLVAQALETGALPGHLELVGCVLEQSSPWQEPKAVSLSPGLLGSGWGEDAPTWVLLEECGLELQVDAPQVRWQPRAQGRTCALYAALTLLLRLGQAPC